MIYSNLGDIIRKSEKAEVLAFSYLNLDRGDVPCPAVL